MSKESALAFAGPEMVVAVGSAMIALGLLETRIDQHLEFMVGDQIYWKRIGKMTKKEKISIYFELLDRFGFTPKKQIEEGRKKAEFLFEIRNLIAHQAIRVTVSKRITMGKLSKPLPPLPEPKKKFVQITSENGKRKIKELYSEDILAIAQSSEELRWQLEEMHILLRDNLRKR